MKLSPKDEQVIDEYLLIGDKNKAYLKYNGRNTEKSPNKISGFFNRKIVQAYIQSKTASIKERNLISQDYLVNECVAGIKIAKTKDHEGVYKNFSQFSPIMANLMRLTGHYKENISLDIKHVDKLTQKELEAEYEKLIKKVKGEVIDAEVIEEKLIEAK